MQGIILDVEMPRNAKITADFNGKRYEHSLAELLEGSRAHFLRGWLSEAIQFERAATVPTFCVGHIMTDEKQSAIPIIIMPEFVSATVSGHGLRLSG